jgi:uncharacterized protein YndB with AHSA1/START domain
MGRITRTNEGGYVLTYERLLRQSPARVWAALTDPAILTRWMANSDVELRIGGKFVIYFFDGKETMSGVIRALERERLIEYTWIEDNSPPSLVRWTIKPVGDGSRLTLTHTLPPGTEHAVVSELGGGWHAILDNLDPALAGEQAVYDAERLRPLEALYGELLGETGAA